MIYEKHNLRSISKDMICEGLYGLVLYCSEDSIDEAIEKARNEFNDFMDENNLGSREDPQIIVKHDVNDSPFASAEETAGLPCSVGVKAYLIPKTVL